jgi:hypothetical protein
MARSCTYHETVTAYDFLALCEASETYISRETVIAYDFLETQYP